MEGILRQPLHSSQKCVVERVLCTNGHSAHVTKKYFKRALRPQSLRARHEDPLQAVHREAELMKRAKHPGIVELLAVKEDEHVIELEMSDGGDSLTADRYSVEDTRLWLKSVTRALVSLHSQSIVHLDIKPSNIVVKNKIAQVCDFGSAMECSPTGQLTKYPQLTPAFSSPEFCLMSMSAGSAVGMIQGRPQDMWSLGVTLYSFLFGRMPFKCQDDVMTCYTSIMEDTPDMTGKVINEGKEGELPSEMLTCLQGLLDKSPTKRLTVEQLYKILTK